MSGIGGREEGENVVTRGRARSNLLLHGSFLNLQYTQCKILIRTM